MTAFAIGFIAYGIQATITPLLWGRGAVDKEAIPQFAMALLLGLVAWVASGISTLMVAWAFAAINVCRCAWIVANAITTFGAPPATCAYALLRSAAAGSVLGCCVWLADEAIKKTATAPLLWLAIDGLVLLTLGWLALLKRDLWLHRPLTQLLERKLGNSAA